jgi:hypothetical protein
MAAVDRVLVGVTERDVRRGPAIAVHLGAARGALLLDGRTGRDRAERRLEACAQVDDLEAVERMAAPGLVRALALRVDSHPVGAHRVRDVRPSRVDVDGVRLADVAREADLLWVVDVGDVDDLQPATRCFGEPGDALVMTAPGRVRGVEQQPRVAPSGVGHVGVEDRVALRRRLDVVLEAERRRRV